MWTRPMILAELRMYISTHGTRARNHSNGMQSSSCKLLSPLPLSLPLLFYARYSGANKAFMSWQIVHGRSFVFARTDWEYVLNTFSFGYAIGYHFIASDKGSCNGNFLGIGMTLIESFSHTHPPPSTTRIDTVFIRIVATATINFSLV